MFARVRKHLGTSGLAFRVWGRIEEQIITRWVCVRDHEVGLCEGSISDK